MAPTKGVQKALARTKKKTAGSAPGARKLPLENSNPPLNSYNISLAERTVKAAP
jgi:hypothetical protein